MQKTEENQRLDLVKRFVQLMFDLDQNRLNEDKKNRFDDLKGILEECNDR